MATAITIAATVLAVLLLLLPLARFIVQRTQTPKDDQALALVEPVLAMLARALGVKAPEQAAGAPLTAPAPSEPTPILRERDGASRAR